MSLKTNIFFVTVLLLVCSVWFSNFDKFGGRKCPPYRTYKLSFSFHSGAECYQGSHPEFENLSTLEEIKQRGYNASRYKIISEDGYISTIIRIFGSATSPPKGNKPVILIFHGLAASSCHWIIQRGSRNLAFTLVNADYEVWLADLRGTSSSMKHTHLDPDIDRSYWNFNMDDIAAKDLPLFLDLIKNETGNEKIYFACHSTGCAIWLAGLSELPELNGRFKAGFMMAPAVHFGTIYSPIFKLYYAIFETPLDRLIFALLKGRYDGRSSGIARALGLTPGKLCKYWSYLRCGICDNWLFALYGNDETQLDYENLSNIMSKIYDVVPEGLVRHQVQNILNCNFRKFDYGMERNELEYGSPEPPTYNLEGVRVPIYIFYGENDNFVTRLDAEKTRDAISARFMRGFYQVEWPLFTHPDFLMAKDADILVYNKILSIINESESEEYLNGQLYTHEFRNNSKLNTVFTPFTRPKFCQKQN